MGGGAVTSLQVATLFQLSGIRIPLVLLSVTASVSLTLSVVVMMLLLTEGLEALRRFLELPPSRAEAWEDGASRELVAFPVRAARITGAIWLGNTCMLGLSLFMTGALPLALIVRASIVALLFTPALALMARAWAAHRTQTLQRELWSRTPGARALLERTVPDRGSFRTLWQRYVTFAVLALLANVANVASVSLGVGSDSLLPLVTAGVVTTLFLCHALVPLALHLRVPLMELARQAGSYQRGQGPRPTVWADGEVGRAARAWEELAVRMDAPPAAPDALLAERTQLEAWVQRLLQEGGSESLTSMRDHLRNAQWASNTLAQSSHDVSTFSSELARLTEQTEKQIDQAIRGTATFQISSQRATRGAEATAQAVGELTGRVQQLETIVDFISNIAERYDLIAVNAELESHGRGNSGSGLTLVASEMRRLAETALESTVSTHAVIDRIQSAIAEAQRAAQDCRSAAQNALATRTRIDAALSHHEDLTRSMRDITSDALVTVGQQRTHLNSLEHQLRVFNQLLIDREEVHASLQEAFREWNARDGRTA